MIRKLIYTIDETFDKKPVQSFLRSQGSSSRMLKELKKNPHGILIGNKKCTALKLLKKGDTLTVYIKEKSEYFFSFEKEVLPTERVRETPSATISALMV